MAAPEGYGSSQGNTHVRMEQLPAMLPAVAPELAVNAQIAGSTEICQGVEDEYAIIKIGQRS
jgi:hypothetical protein